jgi:hypothetical protein
MQTLTLKIEDNYYQKVVDFLELLPKKAVKIETPKHHDKYAKEREIANGVLQGIKDVKAGKTFSMEEFKAAIR